MKYPKIGSSAAEWWAWRDVVKPAGGHYEENAEEYYARLVDTREREKEKYHDSLLPRQCFVYCKPYYFISKNYYNVFTGRQIEVSHLGECRRGRVTSFSAASRRRFQLRIEEYADVEFTWFITLTYEEFQPDMLASYRHLENFCKVFDRLYKKKHLYLWKKEFQRRGVVHYHLICNLPKDVSKTAITRIWNRCAGQVYRKCGKLNKSSTNCSKVKKQQSIGWYLSQYVEKKNHQTDAPVDRLSAVNRDGETVAGYIGRWWGVINKKNYVRRVIEKIIVDAETARLIEELIHSVDGSDDWRYREHRSNFYFRQESIARKIVALAAPEAFNFRDNFGAVRALTYKALA